MLVRSSHMAFYRYPLVLRNLFQPTNFPMFRYHICDIVFNCSRWDTTLIRRKIISSFHMSFLKSKVYKEKSPEQNVKHNVHVCVDHIHLSDGDGRSLNSCSNAKYFFSVVTIGIATEIGKKENPQCAENYRLLYFVFQSKFENTFHFQQMDIEYKDRFAGKSRSCTVFS